MNRLFDIQKQFLPFSNHSSSDCYEKIIIGEDFYSLLFASQLQIKNLSSTKFLHPKALQEHHLIHQYDFFCRKTPHDLPFYPTQDCDRQNIFSEAQKSSNPNSLYYFKDQKIRPFTLQLKTSPLHFFESYFRFPHFALNHFDHLPFDLQQQVLTLLESPPDLIDSIHFDDQEKSYPWTVHLKNNRILKTKLLFFNLGIDYFYQYFKDKNQLAPELATYALSIQHKPYFLWSLQLSKALFPEGGTIFIPQSLTHDWGHFISQHPPAINHQGPLTVLSYCLFEEEEFSDLVSKKWITLKKWFQKMFPGYQKWIIHEALHLENRIPFSKNLISPKDKNIVLLKKHLTAWEEKGLYLMGFDSPTDSFIQHAQETNFLQNALSRYTQLYEIFMR
jgi:hypothetical protein